MKQLTLFEVLAAIVPGALLILGFVYQYGSVTMIEKHGSMSIGELTVLTLASLTVGMLLQGLARFVKDCLAKRIMPVRFTLYTSRPRLISPMQQERVKAVLESRYGIPRNADGRDREQREAIKMGYKEAIVELRNEGYSERFERLTVYQAMYRGILSACTILTLFSFNASIAQPSKGWMIAVLPISMALILARMLQSERTRTTEMFLQLLIQESAGRAEKPEHMLSVNSNERQ